MFSSTRNCCDTQQTWQNDELLYIYILSTFAHTVLDDCVLAVCRLIIFGTDQKINLLGHGLDFSRIVYTGTVSYKLFHLPTWQYKPMQFGPFPIWCASTSFLFNSMFRSLKLFRCDDAIQCDWRNNAVIIKLSFKSFITPFIEIIVFDCSRIVFIAVLTNWNPFCMNWITSERGNIMLCIVSLRKIIFGTDQIGKGSKSEPLLSDCTYLSYLTRTRLKEASRIQRKRVVLSILARIDGTEGNGLDCAKEIGWIVDKTSLKRERVGPKGSYSDSHAKKEASRTGDETNKETKENRSDCT